MSSGLVELHVLWRDTNIALRHYHARVKEGKDLEAAVYFARFIRNSGLCNLLDAHASKGPLPCEGMTVRKSAEKLERDVCRRWETNDTKPQLQTSDLEEIRAELAQLRAHVGAAPPLRIVEGRDNG